jgi:transposase InsO family protein
VPAQTALRRDHPERSWPPPYPNLLADAPLTDRDQAWVADITYIRLPTVFVYLACVLDAWSRRCLDWHLSHRIDTSLSLAALDHALDPRQPAPGVIHHSDRGVQYASAAYVDRLTEAGARIRMSAVGNPYDNAKAESFFTTLKREEVYLNHDDSLADAEANLGHFIGWEADCLYALSDDAEWRQGAMDHECRWQQCACHLWQHVC